MIVFNDADHGRRIAENTSTPFTPATDRCISRVDENGELMGGVIYQQYQFRSVQIHVCGFKPNWLCRDLLWAMFDYAFNQMGVEQVLGIVPSTNMQALLFDHKVGFKYVTKIPGAVIGGDYIVIAMYKDDCRWLDIVPRTIISNVSRGIASNVSKVLH